MPLPPLFNGDRPDTTAMYVRARLIEMLYANDFDGMFNLAHQWGKVAIPYVHWRPASWPPSMAIMNVDNSWELLFTGTANVQQVGLHVGGVVSVRTVPPSGVLSGTWALVADSVWSEALGNGLGDASPDRLVVSGHSYGGAVAGIVAMSAAARFGPDRVSTVSYGGPRYRGGVLAVPQPSATLRVVNSGDPVPLVPPQRGSAAITRGLLGIASPRSRLVPWRHVGYRLGITPGASLVYSGSEVEEPAALVTWATASGIAVHRIAEYARRLLQSGGVQWPTDNSQEAGNGTPGWNQGQTELDKIPKDGGLDPEVANQVYYGAPTGPIASDNLHVFESTGLTVLSASVSPPTNIGAFIRGEKVAANSGLTKITLVINNSVYGKTESHVIPIGIDDTRLPAQVGILAGLRAKLLGNGQTVAGNYIKDRASPQIQFVRLTDALFPRLGQVYDWTSKQYFGFPSVTTPNNAADFGAVAMTIRPRGNIDANPPRSSTLQLTFNPDSLYANGVFDPAFASPGQQPWLTQLEYYWGHLAGGGGIHYGFMGDDPTIPPLQCILVANVNGQWQFTFPTAAWQTGDRVRFAKFGPVFSKTWTLVKIADHVYALRNQPVSGHTPPPLGTAQLVQFASGVSAKAFYPYSGVQRTEAMALQVKVSKHNPGKEWISVSFHHKVRRER